MSAINSDFGLPDLLIGENFATHLDQLIIDAEEQIYVATAFCKSVEFRELARLVNNKISKKMIIVRWQLVDILSGASDLKAYDVAKDFGWSFFIHKDLHAKIYFNEMNAIVSSGNLTRRGTFGFPPQGNWECSVALPTSEILKDWFASIRNDSIEVDDLIYGEIAKQVAQSENFYNAPEFSSDFISELEVNSDVGFFTHDLFWTATPDELKRVSFKDADVNIRHDLMLLELTIPFSDRAVRDHFLSSRPFRWLKRSSSEGIYFGELSALMHDALRDDPAPFRKDIKGLLVNLLNWTKALAPDFIAISRPNHSEFIKTL